MSLGTIGKCFSDSQWVTKDQFKGYSRLGTSCLKTEAEMAVET